MNYDELAEKLIEAENESERTTLLGNVAGGDILELAYALKNTY